MMHRLTSPSDVERRRSGRNSGGVRRTVALLTVLGAGVGVMAAQTNTPSPSPASVVNQQSGAQAQPQPPLNVQGPASEATYSTSASDGADGLSTEASVVPTTPDFSKMMLYGAGQGYGYHRARYRGREESHPWTLYFGAGFTQPIGDTWRYLTPNFGVQVGTGPQFGRHFAVPVEFDYDYFDMTRNTLDDQSIIYFNQEHVGLGGNSHISSLSLEPTITLHAGERTGLYVVGGVGFYHKIANFTLPGQAYSCFYYCGVYATNVNIDHYTSNAPGYDGGIGLTFRLASNSSARFYVEGRYVFISNQQRYGVTINNYTTAPTTSTDFFPENSNRTTYIPVKAGFRF